MCHSRVWFKSWQECFALPSSVLVRCPRYHDVRGWTFEANTSGFSQVVTSHSVTISPCLPCSTRTAAAQAADAAAQAADVEAVTPLTAQSAKFSDLAEVLGRAHSPDSGGSYSGDPAVFHRSAIQLVPQERIQE